MQKELHLLFVFFNLFPPKKSENAIMTHLRILRVEKEKRTNISEEKGDKIKSVGKTEDPSSGQITLQILLLIFSKILGYLTGIPDKVGYQYATMNGKIYKCAILSRKNAWHVTVNHIF